MFDRYRTQYTYHTHMNTRTYTCTRIHTHSHTLTHTHTHILPQLSSPDHLSQTSVVAPQRLSWLTLSAGRSATHSKRLTCRWWRWHHLATSFGVEGWSRINYRITSAPLNWYNKLGVHYCRTIFSCEYLLIANCKLFPHLQLVDSQT